MRTRLAPLLPACLILLATSGLARADVIDGEWCFDDGRHFTIRGAEITTPEGVTTTGTYSRHAFSYTSPVGTNPRIDMRLVNEFTVHLRAGAESSTPVQVWKRCQPVS